MKASTLRGEKLQPAEGPTVVAINKSLVAIGVERQAYHGGSFIGNHVHKCLKVCDMCNKARYNNNLLIIQLIN